MPAFLVELPSDKRVQGADALVIFAADEAGARLAAQGQFDGDFNTLWGDAETTVTEIVAGAELADAGDGWTIHGRIEGGAGQTAGFDPYVFEVDGLSRNPAAGRLGEVRLHIGAVAINDGGMATYVVDEILTAAGGTFTRAATFRVTSVNTGVIDGIELVDPGEYSELPSLTANAVTGGSGSAALMDLTVAAEGSYEALLAQALAAISANPDIDGAVIDLSEGGSGLRSLLVASGSNETGGTDDIGDATVTFEVRQNGVAFPVLVSTIADEGAVDDDLSVAIPASPIAPGRVVRVKKLIP